jgi:hypothetical protein
MFFVKIGGKEYTRVVVADGIGSDCDGAFYVIANNRLIERDEGTVLTVTAPDSRLVA